MLPTKQASRADKKSYDWREKVYVPIQFFMMWLMLFDLVTHELTAVVFYPLGVDITCNVVTKCDGMALALHHHIGRCLLLFAY